MEPMKIVSFQEPATFHRFRKPLLFGIHRVPDGCQYLLSYKAEALLQPRVTVEDSQPLDRQSATQPTG